MRLSVIIVSYNVRDLLENCLHSVARALDGIDGEVFVVDNASDDGSADMVRKEFPSIILHASEENLGFARANNIALAEVRGDYLLLLNPDTLVQEDTFRTMLAFFDSHPDIGMAGCRIITPDGSLEPACRRSFPSPWVSFTRLSGLSSLFPDSPLFARYNLTYLDEHASYDVDAISGSFMMLRTIVYEQIGGLDEAFFMYGEDLDWCYRVQRAGWRIHYVHETTIIHYGGVSTRRSSIDATAVFYRAMELFARKNLRLSPFTAGVIHAGIKLRLWVTRSRRLIERAGPVALDAVLIVLGLFVGELMRFGELFRFPDYAYPTVQIVSVLVMTGTIAASGAYTRKTYTVMRSAAGVFFGFLALSALTFFFKDFAFSRAVVLLAGGLAMIAIPAWRILAAVFSADRRTTLVTGRPTLLVGLTDQAIAVLDRLRRYDAQSYRVVGLVDLTRRRMGERIEGVEVLGSVETIEKIIRERRVSEVIFAPDVLSYGEILSIIGRVHDERVTWRLVPRSMEYAASTGVIDQPASVPLLDVEVNLLRFRNRFLKRALDLVVAGAGLITLGPFVYFVSVSGSSPCSLSRMVRSFPAILAGRMSLIGHPADRVPAIPATVVGRPGITGLVQLRDTDDLRDEEVTMLTVQYLRNHSIFLDFEILLRTVALCAARARR